jgi:hypothetical protein
MILCNDRVHISMVNDQRRKKRGSYFCEKDSRSALRARDPQHSEAPPTGIVVKLISNFTTIPVGGASVAETDPAEGF